MYIIMDAKLIEKLDRQRYLAVVLQAVGLLEIAVMVARGFIQSWNHIPMPFFGSYGGVPLFLGAGIWYLVIEGRILRNMELRDALHNEMYLAYKQRSGRIALWVVLWALVVGAFLSTVDPSVPGFLFCEAILCLGLAVLKVSWLIFNRR